MTNNELLLEVKDIRLHHELCVQKCIQLEKKLADVSTSSSKKTKKQAYEDFQKSDACRLVLMRRDKNILKKQNKNL